MILKEFKSYSNIISDNKGKKLEFQNGQKSGKYPNTWKLNDTLQKKPCIEEFKRKIRKHFERNENENTTYQHLWDEAKAVIKLKCRALKFYIKKVWKLDKNVHLKKLQK